MKVLADASLSGQPAMFVRDSRTTAVVDGERFRSLLARLIPAGVEVVHEEGVWAVFIPGLPIAAEGATFNEAVDVTVDELVDYADAWVERLGSAPNHKDNWGLVQLIALSNKVQLRDWVIGDTQSRQRAVKDV